MAPRERKQGWDPGPPSGGDLLHHDGVKRSLPSVLGGSCARYGAFLLFLPKGAAVALERKKIAPEQGLPLGRVASREYSAPARRQTRPRQPAPRLRLHPSSSPRGRASSLPLDDTGRWRSSEEGRRRASVCNNDHLTTPHFLWLFDPSRSLLVLLSMLAPPPARSCISWLL